MHPLINIAVSAARTAGNYIMRNLDRVPNLQIDRKGRNDFVTQVDRNAEAEIIKVIHKAYPAHAILGEEGGQIGENDVLWIVDPLDGTTNFLHGYPEYCASVAVAQDGELVAGAIVAADGTEFTAARGAGARRDGEPIGVSSIDRLELALIGTGFPFKDLSGFGDYLRQFEWIAARTAGIRRAGSAALDLCAVAAGAFEGFWEQRLAPWDVAAGMLLVREAGGRVTDFAGRDIGVEHGPVLAGNLAIHRWMVEGLRSER